MAKERGRGDRWVQRGEKDRETEGGKKERETERGREPEEKLKRLGGKVLLLPLGLCLPILDTLLPSEFTPPLLTWDSPPRSL